MLFMENITRDQQSNTPDQYAFFQIVKLLIERGQKIRNAEGMNESPRGQNEESTLSEPGNDDNIEQVNLR